MSAPNDWLQFYHQNFPAQADPSSVSDATDPIVTTVAAATPTSSPPPGMLNSSSSTSTHLTPEGRVSKPIRRRSRASRRTPTTLLNTDTTNFRAMVQQFTGGATAPFAPTASMAAAAAAATSGLPNLGFGFGSRQAYVNPTGFMVGPPGYHIQQQQQQLYQPPPPPQNQQFMYNSNTEGGDNNTFFQRLSGSPRPRNVIDHAGEFLMDNHGGRFFPKQ